MVKIGFEIVDEVKVKVEKVEGKRVFAKIGKQRRARDFIAFRDERGRLIAQADDCIIYFVNEQEGVALYNLRGCYFVHLRPELGARVGKFPEEFVKALSEVVIEKGELLGFVEGSPVYFGGCRTF